MNIEINIPQASEAKLIILKGEYEKAKNQIRIVEESILGAIEQGHNWVSLGETLELCVKNKLEEMGYTINSSSGRNETQTTISWQ